MEDQVVRTAIVELKRPFEVGGKEVTKVILSEPPASKLRGVKLNLPASKDIKQIEIDIDTAITVVEICGDLTPPEVAKMSLMDVNEVYWACIQLFFG